MVFLSFAWRSMDAKKGEKPLDERIKAFLDEWLKESFTTFAAPPEGHDMLTHYALRTLEALTNHVIDLDGAGVPEKLAMLKALRETGPRILEVAKKVGDFFFPKGYLISDAVATKLGLMAIEVAIKYAGLARGTFKPSEAERKVLKTIAHKLVDELIDYIYNMKNRPRHFRSAEDAPGVLGLSILVFSMLPPAYVKTLPASKWGWLGGEAQPESVFQALERAHQKAQEGQKHAE